MLVIVLQTPYGLLPQVKRQHFIRAAKMFLWWVELLGPCQSCHSSVFLWNTHLCPLSGTSSTCMEHSNIQFIPAPETNLQPASALRCNLHKLPTLSLSDPSSLDLHASASICSDQYFRLYTLDLSLQYKSHIFSLKKNGCTQIWSKIRQKGAFSTNLESWSLAALYCMLNQVTKLHSNE